MFGIIWCIVNQHDYCNHKKIPFQFTKIITPTFENTIKNLYVYTPIKKISSMKKTLKKSINNQNYLKIK